MEKGWAPCPVVATNITHTPFRNTVDYSSGPTEAMLIPLSEQLSANYLMRSRACPVSDAHLRCTSILLSTLNDIVIEYVIDSNEESK